MAQALCRRMAGKLSSALIKVLGCVAIWRHRSLLLKFFVAAAILLMLRGNGRMTEEVGEQGYPCFQLSLAWRGPRAPKVHLCAVAFKYHKWRCGMVYKHSLCRHLATQGALRRPAGCRSVTTIVKNVTIW